MTKPEQLAEESCKGSPDTSAHYDGFLAGYQAAIEQVQKAWPDYNEVIAKDNEWCNNYSARFSPLHVSDYLRSTLLERLRDD